MRQLIVFFTVFMVFGALPQILFAEQTLVAQRVGKEPIIDGTDADPAWTKVKTITTHDDVADIDITLKAVYTGKKIFLLVSFPDPDESRTHKSWVWDRGMELYKMGNDREDVFVFKWNMGASPVDLSIYAENPYKADVWFWKACRTDPVGYADDKLHILSSKYMKDATELTSKGGKTTYLLRQGDSGVAAFRTKLQIEHVSDVVRRFIYQTPSGSRADVKAKGVWMDGKWTIEFGRALNTGNDDDVQFDLKKGYQFGVSRYEIAGRKPNPQLTQPFYGSGDVSEVLTLIFANTYPGEIKRGIVKRIGGQ